MKKLLLLLSCFLLGCTPKTEDKPLVLVSISPYISLVQQIAGDTVQIQSVVPTGYNAHNFDFSPKLVAKLDRAKLFFGVGEPFEKKVLRAIHSDELTYVNLSEYVPFLLYDEGHTHEHEHHHSHSYDTHIWLDPVMLFPQVDAISQELTSHFPTHAKLYAENSTQLKREITKVNQHIAELLSIVKGKSILISHPALGYYCKTYGLEQLSIEVEGKDPLPRELEKVFQKAKVNPPLCVFRLPGFNDKAAALMAEKLDIPLYDLNPYAPDILENLLQITHEIMRAND